jgi:hypothetical protein
MCVCMHACCSRIIQHGYIDSSQVHIHTYYTYMHLYACTLQYICMYVCIDVCIYVCMLHQVQAYVPVHTYTHTYVQYTTIHTYACMYVYGRYVWYVGVDTHPWKHGFHGQPFGWYTYIHTRANTHICVRTHTYIHTRYTNIHTR